MGQIDERLKELGIELPKAPVPVASYVGAVRSGNHLFLAGHTPGLNGEPLVPGKLGRDFSIEQGYAAARECGLNLLAVAKAELGDLDRVTRVVKLLGMVNCDPDFTDLSKVINGCSDLLVEVFGEHGKHARSAVGMGSLPFGVPVEVELILEVT